MLHGRGHIAVSGLIGAGKSTVVNGLARVLPGRAFAERTETNPYFDAFYRDPPAFAFRHFVFFFAQALADQVEALQFDGYAIQERIPPEHLDVFGAEFFARGYLSADDWSLLQRLAKTCESLVQRPVLLVHIDIRVDDALRRLRQRARDAEIHIDRRYLTALSQRYDTFVREWTASPVLRLDAEEYDFRSEVHLEMISQLVARELGETNDGRRSAAG